MRTVRFYANSAIVAPGSCDTVFILVRQAILDLFEAKCDKFSLDDDTYDIDSFEQEGEHWNVLSGKTRPNIVYGDAYCGRRFLEV